MHSGSLRMASMLRRRVIQLRPDISVGNDAIGTATSMTSGYFWAYIQVCMPPIEFPSTSRRGRTPIGGQARQGSQLECQTAHRIRKNREALHVGLLRDVS